MSTQMDLLRRVYSVGLRAGNVEYGFWCQHATSYIYPMIMGKPLQSIDTYCAECVPQMEELQQVGTVPIVPWLIRVSYFCLISF